MLKLFDQNHRPLGMISEYSGLKITSHLDTGDKELEFVPNTNSRFEIKCEYYIQTKDDEYVVKEPGDTIVCNLNLDDLVGTPYKVFSIVEQSIRYGVQKALSGTGWEVGICDIPDDDRRNAGMINTDALKIINDLCTVWSAEPEFDTLRKKVNIYKERGKYRGCYFAEGLNLRSMKKTSSSYDFYTILIPEGADGLDITSVNGGENYIEDFGYSTKRKAMYWIDESYTDPQALLDDARLYLNDLSSPEESYSCDVIDLAKAKKNAKYKVFYYSLGDTVIIIDKKSKKKIKHRIVEMVEFPDDPSKNSITLANKLIKFTELQSLRKKASDIALYEVEDGIYSGTVSLSQIIADINKRLKEGGL